MDEKPHKPFLEFIKNHWFFIAQVVILLAFVIAYVIDVSVHKSPSFFNRGTSGSNITTRYITNLIIASASESPCSSTGAYSIPIPTFDMTTGTPVYINNINQQGSGSSASSDAVQLCATAPDIIYVTDQVLVDLKINRFDDNGTLKPSLQKCPEGYSVVASTINQNDLQGILPYNNQNLCSVTNGICAKYMSYQNAVKNNIKPLSFYDISVMVNDTTTPTCSTNIRPSGCNPSLVPVCLNIKK